MRVSLRVGSARALPSRLLSWSPWIILLSSQSQHSTLGPTPGDGLLLVLDLHSLKDTSSFSFLSGSSVWAPAPLPLPGTAGQLCKAAPAPCVTVPSADFHAAPGAFVSVCVLVYSLRISPRTLVGAKHPRTLQWAESCLLFLGVHINFDGVWSVARTSQNKVVSLSLCIAQSLSLHAKSSLGGIFTLLLKGWLPLNSSSADV